MAEESPFVIEVEGLEELQRALEGFGKGWQQSADRAMKPGLAILESEAKRTARADTGQTRASIGSKVERTLGSEIVGKVGSSLEHAPYALEYGRLPGAMPPPDRIEEWAGRHGMAGLGFVIARAIGARGVKAPHTLSNVVKAKAREVVRKFEEGIDRELRRLGLR